jgi:hypothetical protein
MIKSKKELTMQRFKIDNITLSTPGTPGTLGTLGTLGT